MLALSRGNLRLLTWLVIALHAVAGCVRARSLVVCLSATGHVRMEIQKDEASCECCRQHESDRTEQSGTGQRGPEQGDGPSLAPRGCCTHVDLQLADLRDESARRARASSQEDGRADDRSVPVAAAIPAGGPVAPRAARGFARLTRHRETGPILHLRTLVLRI